MRSFLTLAVVSWGLMVTQVQAIPGVLAFSASDPPSSFSCAEPVYVEGSTIKSCEDDSVTTSSCLVSGSTPALAFDALCYPTLADNNGELTDADACTPYAAGTLIDRACCFLTPGNGSVANQDCANALDDPNARCLPFPVGANFPTDIGVCVSQRNSAEDYCTTSSDSTVNVGQIAACLSIDGSNPGEALQTSYAEGDCDRDGRPNGVDCDPCNDQERRTRQQCADDAEDEALPDAPEETPEPEEEASSPATSSDAALDETQLATDLGFAGGGGCSAATATQGTLAFWLACVWLILNRRRQLRLADRACSKAGHRA